MVFSPSTPSRLKCRLWGAWVASSVKHLSSVATVTSSCLPLGALARGLPCSTRIGCNSDKGSMFADGFQAAGHCKAGMSPSDWLFLPMFHR